MLESTFTKVSKIATDNCITRIDDWLLETVGTLIRPTVVFIVLIAIAEAALKILEAPEIERFIQGCLFLLVVGYSSVATIALLKMAWDARPILNTMWRARINPRQFLRAAIFTGALDVIDEHKAEWPNLFAVGHSIASWCGYASPTDTLALRIVQTAAPAIEAHLVKRAFAVMLPIAGTYAYLRYDLLPSLAHVEGHLAILQTGLYPFVAVWRLLGGH
ncbi:hypothetical protein [Azospirillum melinis]